MEKYVKFLRKLPRLLQAKIIRAIEKLVARNFQHLDIKRLGKTSLELYRCRVGKIRIIFMKRGEKIVIYDIGFRGDIYKNL